MNQKSQGSEISPNAIPQNELRESSAPVDSSRAAKSAAFPKGMEQNSQADAWAVNFAASDPELAELIRLWRTLPPDASAALVRFLRTLSKIHNPESKLPHG